MLMDYHLHTEFSGDSTAPMEEVCRAAQALGLRFIAITDHHDIALEKFRLANFSQYLEKIEQCRTLFPDLTIARGLELDYRAETWERMQSIPERLELDYPLLSLHYVEGIDPYLPEYFATRTQRQGYERYLLDLTDMLRRVEGHYVLGHLSYVAKFAPFTENTMHYADYADLIDEVLHLLVSKGFGMELNTSGLKNNAGILPGLDILKRYRELGGEILTVGSDAHTPDAVGRWLPEAMEQALNGGFRYLAVYRHRKPVFFPI